MAKVNCGKMVKSDMPLKPVKSPSVKAKKTMAVASKAKADKYNGK
jgi:hypothetical protein